MDLDNHAAESGLDTGNAGGEVRNDAPREAGLSLRDTLTKAAASIRDRASDNGSANPASGDTNNAFEKSETQTRSLPDQAGSQEGAASPILEAPKHWPQKRRDAFGRFVGEKPDLAKEWLDHTKELEGEFTRKSQEHADHRKFADSVREHFTPEERERFKQNGSSEAQAVGWLTQMYRSAEADPAAYVQWFMQQKGLNPQQLFPNLGQGQPNGQGNSAQDEWTDPEVLKLREELGSLKSQYQQHQAYLQNQEATRRAESQQTIGRTIQQFAEAADETGNPVHPHFQAVEERMAWELQNNPELMSLPLGVEKLKAAYDIAVWANPTTRQAMLDATRNAEMADAAKRQAADKARAAQTIKPRISSVGGAMTPGPEDLKSLIRNAAGRARG
jgi:hypothetical protein